MITHSASKDSRKTAESASEAVSAQPVIFFDGVCGLCNHFVNFILARDSAGLFLFAPLQGTTAKDRLELPSHDSFDSVVLIDGLSTYQKSAAVVRILWKLGGFWKMLGCVIWAIPWPIRDLGYSFVALLRYRIFGKKDACRMPTPEERGRFLD